MRRKVVQTIMLVGLLGLMATAVHAQMRMRKQGEYYHLRDSLPEKYWIHLAEADQIILYSLLPEKKDSQGASSFYGYPVLDRVDISDPQIMRNISSALRAGAEEGTLGFRCFDPHHGVRAIHGEATIDMVLCFQCTNMLVFASTGSEAPVMADISRAPEALIEELLRAAKSREGSSLRP